MVRSWQINGQDILKKVIAMRFIIKFQTAKPIDQFNVDLQKRTCKIFIQVLKIIHMCCIVSLYRNTIHEGQ
ncbi:hypothetical protein JCM17380_27020 [Desulfosporosinus burensis]